MMAIVDTRVVGTTRVVGLGRLPATLAQWAVFALESPLDWPKIVRSTPGLGLSKVGADISPLSFHTCHLCIWSAGFPTQSCILSFTGLTSPSAVTSSVSVSISACFLGTDSFGACILLSEQGALHCHFYWAPQMRLPALWRLK